MADEYVVVLTLEEADALGGLGGQNARTLLEEGAQAAVIRYFERRGKRRSETMPAKLMTKVLEVIKKSAPRAAAKKKAVAKVGKIIENTVARAKRTKKLVKAGKL